MGVGKGVRGWEWKCVGVGVVGVGWGLLVWIMGLVGQLTVDLGSVDDGGTGGRRWDGWGHRRGGIGGVWWY